MTTILQGRGIGRGVAEGLALLAPNSIPGWNGIDAATGVVQEKGNPIYGISIANRVLVLSGGKGSTGWATQFLKARVAGNGPAAMIFPQMDSRSAAASVIAGVPVVTDVTPDIFSIIQSGQKVRVNADLGTIELL